jgi:hypothetical protein
MRLPLGFYAILGLAALVGLPDLASAQYTTLGWQNVRDQPGWVYMLDPACEQPQASHRLFATFRPAENLGEFVGMSATIDLGYAPPGPHPAPSPPLAPFWHFEPDGCNEGALTVGSAMPAGTGLASPWSAGTITQVAYAPDYPQPGRGRRISLLRSSPTALVAGTEYFGFTIDLSMCMGQVCGGCSDTEFRMEFVSADLYGVSQASYVSSNGQDSGVCINLCTIASPFGPPTDPSISSPSFHPVANAAQLCEPTPARAATWGELKVLYR